MVVFTTQQETANVVPILHCRETRVLALDTAFAARAEWGAGSARFLQRRGVEVTRSRIPDGPLPAVIEAIEAAIGGVAGGLTWCLGGGTKLHQFAVSQIQERRWEAGRLDQSVYGDPHRGVLTRIWRAPTGQWESVDEPTSTDIGIDGVLQTFGRQIASSTPPPSAPDRAELEGFRVDAAARRRWMTEEGLRPAFGSMRRYDEYLEQILLHRTASAVPQKTDLQLAANVKVRGGRLEDQEHDVLLADARGRLLSIDAKAGVPRNKSARKDLLARLLQLQRSGGVPARFVVAFPYFPADVNQAWFPESLRFLPLQLSNWTLDFCVLTDTDADFWIQRDGQEVRFHSDEAPGRTRCRTLESLLRDWTTLR
jgi:hypothetical protein